MKKFSVIKFNYLANKNKKLIELKKKENINTEKKKKVVNKFKSFSNKEIDEYLNYINNIILTINEEFFFMGLDLSHFTILYHTKKFGALVTNLTFKILYLNPCMMLMNKIYQNPLDTLLNSLLTIHDLLYEKKELPQNFNDTFGEILNNEKESSILEVKVADSLILLFQIDKIYFNNQLKGYIFILYTTDKKENEDKDVIIV
jgi:hypothetical protein